MNRNHCRRGASALIVLIMTVPVLTVGFFALSLANIQRNEAASQISSDLAASYGGNLLGREANAQKVSRLTRQLAKRNWNLSANHHSQVVRPKDLKIDVTIGSTSFGHEGHSFREQSKPANSIRVVTQAPAGVAVFGKERTHVVVSARATVANVERDICLVIDRSGSMTYDVSTGNWPFDSSRHPANPLSTHPSPQMRKDAHFWWFSWPHPKRSRWSKLMIAMDRLAKELERTNQQEVLSIVSYASNNEAYGLGPTAEVQQFKISAASIESNPTKEYRKTVDALRTKYSQKVPIMGATNISAGIDKATELLTRDTTRPNSFKTMIVLTDGQFNQGRAPWHAAKEAAKLGIEVHTITFSNHADQASMILTAEYGDGKHFHAPDAKKLREIFKHIAHLRPRIFVD